MAPTLRTFTQVHPISTYLLMFTGLTGIRRSKLAWERSNWLKLSVVFRILLYASLNLLLLKSICMDQLSYFNYCMMITAVCENSLFIITANDSLTHQNEAIVFFEEQENLFPKYPRNTLSSYQKRIFVIPIILIFIITIPQWHSAGRSFFVIIFSLTNHITPMVYDFYIICVTAPLIHLSRKISHRIKKIVKESLSDSFVRLDSVPKLYTRKLFSKMKCPYDNINNILLQIHKARQLTAKYNLVSGGWGPDCLTDGFVNIDYYNFTYKHTIALYIWYK